MFLGPGAHFDGSVKRQLLGNRFTVVVVVVVGGSHLAGVSSAAQLHVLRERTFKDTVTETSVIIMISVRKNVKRGPEREKWLTCTGGLDTCVPLAGARTSVPDKEFP